MKIVLQTQHRENYGAHDWDGEGECPQYWKCKGGDTYVVHGVTAKEAQSPKFWELLYKAVESKDELFEEYVIGEELVDDIDYVESDHVEDWDAITSLVPAGDDSNPEWLATRVKEADHCWQKGVKGSVELWKQVDGARVDYRLMYEMEDGRTLLYREWLAEKKEANAA